MAGDSSVLQDGSLLSRLDRVLFRLESWLALNGYRDRIDRAGRLQRWDQGGLAPVQSNIDDRAEIAFVIEDLNQRPIVG